MSANFFSLKTSKLTNTTNFKKKLEHCLIYKAVYSLEHTSIVLFSKYQSKWVNEFAEENHFTTLHYSNIFKTYDKQIMRFKKNLKNNIRWKKS